MRVRGTYWIAQIILAAFLLLGLSSLNGMVLCFEPDGRVAIESAIGGVCSDSFQETQHLEKSSTAESSIQAAHCKRCVDVPISMASNEHSKQKLQPFQGPIHMPMVAEAPGVTIGYLATITETQLPHPPPLRPVIHQFLSTVILLI